MSDVLADPPTALVAGAGMLALVLSLVLWPVVTVLVTIAHEGGHAFTGSLMGYTVKYIRIKGGGGGTKFHKDPEGVGGFLAVLAGYAGTSVFGLIGAMLLAHGLVSVVLWLSLVFLVLALLSTSNWAGWVAIVIAGAVIVLVIRYATGGERTFFTYTWIWVLLFGGFGDVVTMQILRKKGGDIVDLGLLRKSTYLPRSLWSGFYWLFSVVVMVVGGAMLLGILAPDPRTWVHHG
jgi:peptidase M50B-like protein